MRERAIRCNVLHSDAAFHTYIALAGTLSAVCTTPINKTTPEPYRLQKYHHRDALNKTKCHLASLTWPPSWLAPSKRVTLCPRSAQPVAAASPAGPDPTTATLFTFSRFTGSRFRVVSYPARGLTRQDACCTKGERHKEKGGERYLCFCNIGMSNGAGGGVMLMLNTAFAGEIPTWRARLMLRESTPVVLRRCRQEERKATEFSTFVKPTKQSRAF